MAVASDALPATAGTTRADSIGHTRVPIPVIRIFTVRVMPHPSNNARPRLLCLKDWVLSLPRGSTGGLVFGACMYVACLVGTQTTVTQLLRACGVSRTSVANCNCTQQCIVHV